MAARLLKEKVLRAASHLLEAAPADLDAADGRVLVSGTDRSLSFREFETAVEVAARALIASGVVAGDRVAIWAPNSGRWVIAACAAQMIGAIMTPINTRFRGQEAAYVLEKSGAKVLFTVGDFLGADYLRMLRAVSGAPAAGRPIAGLPALAAVVLFGVDPVAEGAQSWDGFLSALAPSDGRACARSAAAPATVAAAVLEPFTVT